eukprot:GHVU01185708.1.p2 GENE.GHVU01185708.1~~GHVU01185708.1.p2  ORF type:complete len:125 (-),score=6.46 GHVU01185708.1:5-379(-)
MHGHVCQRHSQTPIHIQTYMYGCARSPLSSGAVQGRTLIHTRTLGDTRRHSQKALSNPRPNVEPPHSSMRTRQRINKTRTDWRVTKTGGAAVPSARMGLRKEEEQRRMKEEVSLYSFALYVCVC